MNDYIAHFRDLNMHKVALVGGKNASLGEMISQLSNLGIAVPDGFATTSTAFYDFLKQNNLNEKIYDLLSKLDVDNVELLSQTGKKIRQWIMEAEFSDEFKNNIQAAYEELSMGDKNLSVAVRSSATAEDLPDASFAGQQETLLNVRGINEVLKAVKIVFASLFNDRAISYRAGRNYDHSQVALSAGIQKMVRSESGASGVMFTLDTETGFNDVVFITAAYGLGETVVQGAVNLDEYYVHKPTLKKGYQSLIRKKIGSKQIKMVYDNSPENTTNKSVKVEKVSDAQQNIFALSDAEVCQLAQQAILIEKHYQCPMDIEWAKDGETNELFIVQARPETVQSRSHANIIERYRLLESGPILVSGRSVGQKIASGAVSLIASPTQMDQFKKGDILVTEMTDPDWEPIMKKAAAIVTEKGGRTCHAAIIAREMGVPAVVGCQGATTILKDKQLITVSCAQGDDGYIYEGALKFDKQTKKLSNLPQLPFNIMVNIGNPDSAFGFSHLPVSGVGLARLEFIISNSIGIHPSAALAYDQLTDQSLKEKIAAKIVGYKDPRSFYIDKLAEGVATIGAAFYPKKVIVRLSDFKSNEYANLLGGSYYEPNEENPMLGFRGASRYVAQNFKNCFELECIALKRVREEMGLSNVEIMVPFVRTITEAKAVISCLESFGLKRGSNGLKLIMMCELPSNALLAEEFLEYFDGFSIGSNDMTQLTLGLDRDSSLVASAFDERDQAVKALLAMAIKACNQNNKYIGICGQGPSDHPDFAKWLADRKIDSISLNPDAVIETWLYLAEHLLDSVNQ